MKLQFTVARRLPARKQPVTSATENVAFGSIADSLAQFTQTAAPKRKADASKVGWPENGCLLTARSGPGFAETSRAKLEMLNHWLYRSPK